MEQHTRYKVAFVGGGYSSTYCEIVTVGSEAELDMHWIHPWISMDWIL